MDYAGIIIPFAGGLGMFIYGMQIMAQGLENAAGSRMKSLLEVLTKNRFFGVLLGAFITAVIQSSSATTVMVVGFVNAGIMNLGQAMGVIMGANIGTTVTGWLVSSVEWAEFLSPARLAPIAVMAGVILMLVGKRRSSKEIASIIVGFGLLFIGITTMSSAVEPLQDSESFTNLFVTLGSNPLLGILAGTLVTAVIQSSSASVGILQSLAAAGLVPFSAAIYIIMGQNIGTCVTAMISSIGTSKNARRAALVHLYFNLIGTAAFLILFYALQSLVGFSFLGDAASPAGIAAVHSVFNIFATVILLPFAKGLEKLAFLTVKEEAGQEIRPQESSDLLHLDIRFLDQPGFAVIQCRRVAVHMARMAQEALSEAVELLGNYQEDKARKVIELEAQVDHYEDQLESYLVKLSGKDLSVKDSHTLSILLHSIGDFERISDHALNIMEGAQKMHRQQMVFSGKASRELKVFTGAVQEIVATAVDVFENEDSHLAEFIEPLEEVIDSLQEELKMRHIMRLRDGRCTIDLGVILSDFITDFERVADHCSNVAVCVIQIQEGGYDAHEYLELLRQPENETFKENVLRYAKKYTLP